MITSSALTSAAGAVHLVDNLVGLRSLERDRIAAPPAWLVAWGKARALAGKALVSTLKRHWFRKIPPLAGVRRATVYSVGTLGDHLVLLPALAALRRGLSGARLTLVVSTGIRGKDLVSDLFSGTSLADEIVYVADPPTARRGLRVGYDEALGGLRGCDLFVNFSPYGNRGLLNAVLRELFVARRIGARSVAGFDLRGWPGKRLHRRLLHTYVGNEPRRAAAVLSELGLAPAATAAAFPPSIEAQGRVLRHLSAAGSGGSVVVINPGAKFPAQRWPVERFVAVARHLHARGFSIAVTGVDEERALGDCVVDGLGSRAVNLAGRTTVQELVELVRHAALCVTNDTGTMHVAALLGRPTVALFTTRQSPTHWFPCGDRTAALMSFVTDRYDYLDGPAAHASLLAIEPDDVLRAIDQLLGVGAAPAAAGSGVAPC